MVVFLFQVLRQKTSRGRRAFKETSPYRAYGIHGDCGTFSEVILYTGIVLRTQVCMFSCSFLFPAEITSPTVRPEASRTWDPSEDCCINPAVCFSSCSRRIFRCLGHPKHMQLPSPRRIVTIHRNPRNSRPRLARHSTGPVQRTRSHLRLPNCHQNGGLCFSSRARVWFLRI